MSQALISTLVPMGGGVPQMADLVASMVRERGIEPIFAYYEPYSLSPLLSVPVHRLLTRRIGKQIHAHNGIESHALGAWLPELEYMNYSSSPYWKELIERCKYHLSVSGNCLAATPYLSEGIPFLSWVATDWVEDRVQRARNFPTYRKVFDWLLNSRQARHLEKSVLDASGTIVALSEYTKTRLNSISHSSVSVTMPMAIDTAFFAPVNARSANPSTVGFVGRLDDPRKNIPLLLEAVRYCHTINPDIHVVLIGDSEDNAVFDMVKAYGFGDILSIIGYMERNDLPAWLNRLDVFVVPSFQEGLCIAALEAMSCGVPVVSTKCGGPEEYVIDDKTGYLVDFDSRLLGDAILRIVSDHDLKNRLSGNARRMIENHYSDRYVRSVFWESFDRTFGSSVCH